MFVQPRTGHHFRSPQNLGKSYVMVGAGGGLGSLIGLLEEITVEWWLAFGSRSIEEDFLYDVLGRFSEVVAC